MCIPAKIRTKKMGREDEIRFIAYRMWEEESCPDGRNCEHWFKAEAIWEEQNTKAAQIPKTASKQTAKRAPKSEEARKNSQKT
jgi:hypothetical protein